MSEVMEYDHYETMNQVIDIYLTGELDPGKIAKRLGLRRVDVIQYIDEWRAVAATNEMLQDRAREAITAMDRHFSLILKEQWGIVNDPMTDNRTKGATLKQISEVESKRQEMLMKAGFYDDAGIGEEMAALEEKYDAIKEILFQVASTSPEVKDMILGKIGAIEGKVQTLPVEGPKDTN